MKHEKRGERFSLRERRGREERKEEEAHALCFHEE